MYYFRKDLKTKKPVSVDVPHRKNMMCLNESTFNPEKILLNGIRKRLRTLSLNRYYNPVTAELHRKLAGYVGVDPEYIACGNGADEMLYYLFITVREDQNSYIVSIAPSYFDYKSYADAVGLGIRFIDLDPDFNFDPNQFLEYASDENCKLLILCNPNNPTGNLLDHEKMLKVIDESGKLVLIDETYYEFTKVSFVDKLDKFDNLTILRSFSKGFSLAGLRFGYLVSQPANISELKKVMTAFHLNLLTQSLVCEVLDNKDIFLEHNRKVIDLRDELITSMKKIPELIVKNSDTNFIILSLGERTLDLFKYMEKSDIAIRNIGSHRILQNYLRVTVGTEKQNEFFLRKVKQYINNNI